MYMGHLGEKLNLSYDKMLEGFVDPAMHFAPHEFWFWDQKLSTLGYKAEDMARELYEKGINPGYAHARANYATMVCKEESKHIQPITREEWLSEKWFNKIEEVLKRTTADGSSFGITDDFGWPSLQAGGRVLDKYPDMYAKSLKYEYRDIKAGETALYKDADFIVAARVASRRNTNYVKFSGNGWKRQKISFDQSSPWDVQTAPYNMACQYTNDVKATAEYHPSLPKEGIYAIYAYWNTFENSSSDVIYRVKSKDETYDIHIDQTKDALKWNCIGQAYLAPGAVIEVLNNAGGVLCVDAIKLENNETEIIVDELEVINRMIATIDFESLTLLDDKVFTAPDGEWRVYAFTVYHQRGYDGSLVDNLDERLAERYAEIAYKPYFDRFDEYMGDKGSLKGFFADTEGGYGFKMAWSETLERHYKELTGAELKRHLPLLFDEALGGSEIRVRCAWYEAVSDIFTAQFAHQSELCARKNMYFTMHTWEESLPFQANLVGSYFKLNRAITLPGTDCLINTAYNPFNFMDTLSVSEFEGRRYMAEMMALAPLREYNMKELKKQVNFLAAWGVSHVIVHAVKTTRIYAQDVVTPDFYNIDPAWKYMKIWADYVRRISYINAQGHVDANVLVYNPMESIWGITEGANMDYDYDMIDIGGGIPGNTASHGGTAGEINRIFGELMRSLSSNRIRFLNTDAHYLIAAHVSGGKLHYKSYSFDTVVLPAMKVINLSAAKRILEFAKAGGKVIIIKSIPDASCENGGNDDELKNVFAEMRALANVHVVSEEDTLDLLTPAIETDRDVRLLSCSRNIDGKRVIWLTNNSEESFEVKLRVRNIWGGVSKLDPMDGSICEVGAEKDGEGVSFLASFAPMEGYFVCIDPEKAPKQFDKKCEETLAVITGMKETEIVCPARLENRYFFTSDDTDHIRLFIRLMPKGIQSAHGKVMLLDGDCEKGSFAWNVENGIEFDDVRVVQKVFDEKIEFTSIVITAEEGELPAEYRLEYKKGHRFINLISEHAEANIRKPLLAKEEKKYIREYIFKGEIQEGATHAIVDAPHQIVELFVNGVAAGVRISPEYAFEIAPYVQKGENELRFIVTGSVANDATIGDSVRIVRR